MYTVKEVLDIEVAPALGCTEPSAVALAAAAAGSLLSSRKPESIELWLDRNIYKNAVAVAIPGAEGEHGIELAAALGFYCGDPAMKLEVLEPVNGEVVRTAKEFIIKHKVEINLLEEMQGIYIRARIVAAGEVAEAVVEGQHDNLTALILNGKPVSDSPLLTTADGEQNRLESLEEFLRGRRLEELVRLVEDMDDEDYEFIMEGVRCNMKLAEYGLEFGGGLGVGKALERLSKEGLIGRDMMLEARILTSAASDARMSGAKLPAMSSAGSGNHGITVVLPIWAVKDYIDDAGREDVLRAIALSHIVTAYIKAHTGRLSAVCGCSIAAGAGATAGIAYLMGGNLGHIAGAIKNLISDLAGVICDGAKASCSLKLATAAGTAVQSALFALHGINVTESDGIIAFTPEQTMKNVGQISTEGMIDTDRTILHILMEKQFSGE